MLTLAQIRQARRKLEGANVARIESDPQAGTVAVTYQGGYRHTFETMQEVEAAEACLRPSGAHTAINGALLQAIIGAH